MRARMGYITVWVAITALATGASMAAVNLVGATVTERPSALPIHSEPPVPAAAQPSSTTSTPTTEKPGATPTTTAPTESSESSIATTSTTAPQEAPTTTVAPTTTTTVPEQTTTTTLPETTGPFTYPVVGGSVTISCHANDVSLGGAVPSSGYSVDVEKAGPEEVRVVFALDETETEVRIECLDGAPEAEVETDD